MFSTTKLLLRVKRSVTGNLWNLIRPTLKCANFCKFQETYEAPIKEAEVNISMAIKECKEVTEKLASVVASGEMVTALCRT